MFNYIPGPENIPDFYSQSRFWRFVLDTKNDSKGFEEPRFKQFSENLRNFAAAAVLFKAALSIPASPHHPFLLVGRMVVLLLATVVTFLSSAQQFGLLVLSSHWFIGWRLPPHMMLIESLSWKGHLRTALRVVISLLITGLFVWGMIAFVLTPIF